MIFLVPMLTMVLYDSRRMKRSGKYLVLILGCALTVLSICMSRYMNPTAKMIFWLSLCGTIYFMIHRNVISGSKKAAYTAASLWTILFGLTILADPGQEERMRTFIEPESMIHSTWDDAYNGSLIQELLSETPWIGGLELSQEELMNYGTGAWYFADRDERKIAYRIPENETDEERQIRKDYETQLREAGILQRYIWYDVSDVTLWNILPQHYHNNYIIAVTMFLFGKIPGIIMIAVAAAYFLRLLSCIQGIQGRLAASLSFGCWQCLVWQCIFYVLGNLGYQYAAFPNMPMLSEGRVSIVFNMFMLGIILSAYRYDRVVEESGVSDDQKDLERMRYKRREAVRL